MAREPAVVTDDVRRVLRDVIQPDDPDAGEAVTRLAERADTSTRTVYRILNPPPSDRSNGRLHTLPLALADRLVLAAGRQLAEIDCRVVLDGRVVDYADA